MEVHETSAGCVAMIIGFHLLLSLMVLAWAHTCFTDPGVPPERWQRRMAALAASGEELRVCRKSGLYKPPRCVYPLCPLVVASPTREEPTSRAERQQRPSCGSRERLVTARAAQLALLLRDAAAHAQHGPLLPVGAAGARNRRPPWPSTAPHPPRWAV